MSMQVLIVFSILVLAFRAAAAIQMKIYGDNYIGGEPLINGQSYIVTCDTSEVPSTAGDWTLRAGDCNNEVLPIKQRSGGVLTAILKVTSFISQVSCCSKTGQWKESLPVQVCNPLQPTNVTLQISVYTSYAMFRINATSTIKGQMDALNCSSKSVRRQASITSSKADFPQLKMVCSFYENSYCERVIPMQLDRSFQVNITDEHNATRSHSTTLVNAKASDIVTINYISDELHCNTSENWAKVAWSALPLRATQRREIIYELQCMCMRTAFGRQLQLGNYSATLANSSETVLQVRLPPGAHCPCSFKWRYTSSGLTSESMVVCETQDGMASIEPTAFVETHGNELGLRIIAPLALAQNGIITYNVRLLDARNKSLVAERNTTKNYVPFQLSDDRDYLVHLRAMTRLGYNTSSVPTQLLVPAMRNNSFALSCSVVSSVDLNSDKIYYRAHCDELHPFDGKRVRFIRTSFACLRVKEDPVGCVEPFSLATSTYNSLEKLNSDSIGLTLDLDGARNQYNRSLIETSSRIGELFSVVDADNDTLLFTTGLREPACIVRTDVPVTPVQVESLDGDLPSVLISFPSYKSPPNSCGELVDWVRAKFCLTKSQGKQCITKHAEVDYSADAVKVSVSLESHESEPGDLFDVKIGLCVLPVNVGDGFSSGCDQSAVKWMPGFYLVRHPVESDQPSNVGQWWIIGAVSLASLITLILVGLFYACKYRHKIQSFFYSKSRHNHSSSSRIPVTGSTVSRRSLSSTYPNDIHVRLRQLNNEPELYSNSNGDDRDSSNELGLKSTKEDNAAFLAHF